MQRKSRYQSKPLVLMIVAIGMGVLFFQNCAEDPDLAKQAASAVAPQVQNPPVSAFRQQTAAAQIIEWGE